MIKTLDEIVIKKVIDYANIAQLHYKDIIKIRTKEERSEHITRGIIGEFAAKKDLENEGLQISDVNLTIQPTGGDGGIDLYCLSPKVSLNIRILVGENVDSGRDNTLYFKEYDKGEIYIVYKIYKDYSYEFIGFLNSTICNHGFKTKPGHISIDKLNPNFDQLIITIKEWK